MNLKPAHLAKPAAGLPFKDSIAIESIETDPGADVETKIWQRKLAEVLRNEGIFTRVDDSYRSDSPPGFVLRGKVTGRFRGGVGYGLLNFITWFPGPLIFMPNWRGTRFVYTTRADMELVDTQTRRIVGNYTEETAHKLVHRSSSPAHIFGFIFIIPATVKAIGSTWPRERYRRIIYEAAYTEMWKLIASRIANDRASYYADRTERQRKRCGSRLGVKPDVGATWEDFEACQIQEFTVSGQQPSELGTVTVYLNADRSLEIHVVHGRIVHWFAR